MTAKVTVAPSLGWTYLSRAALARAKAQMDEESMGVRDEIGFLTIHQRYADRFFPGTSVLHSRARYAIFVPWIFNDLAGLTGATAAKALKNRETELAGWLKDARETQVIGSRVWPNPSSQPPSTVYWNALTVWGILRRRPNGRAPSRAQVHRLLSDVAGGVDDDGQPLLGFDPPFVTLPQPPANWRTGPIDFQMSPPEAEFLRERLGQLRGHGDVELSLLARLVRTQAPAPNSMWSRATRAIAGPDKPALQRAQESASLAAIGRAVYDALVEQLLDARDRREASTLHRDHLDTVLAEHRGLAVNLDVDAMEADIGPLPSKLRAVVTATRGWIATGASDLGKLLCVYEAAEARKGARARLCSTLDARMRRLEWSRDERGLAGPLHYRWEQVATLLNDLAAAG